MPAVTPVMRSWLTTPTALRVPRIIAMFWLLKLLSTAMGEATSDYLVHVILPEAAVLIGFVAFAVSLVVQFRRARYTAWRYWFAVVMVGTFGTMAADVLHVGLGVPYAVSTALYAVALAVVFTAWWRVERTLSFHTIATPRREAFYWAAVVATFAMGTACGDLSATTLHLGYAVSALLFLALILIPLAGYTLLRWNAIVCFWAAYVLTRPLGASIADGLGKAKALGGLGIGDGRVALGFAVAIALGVLYVSLTRADVQEPIAAPLATRRGSDALMPPMRAGDEPR